VKSHLHECECAKDVSRTHSAARVGAHTGSLLLLGALFSLFVLAFQASDAPSIPSTPKHPVVDAYHGVKVTDDYRWLEDGRNSDVIAWSAAQTAYARSLLDPLPLHAALYEFIRGVNEKHSPSYYDLVSRGHEIFAMSSQPGKQQDVLVILKSPDDPASQRIVVDPSALDPTNSTAIQFFVPSPDGSKVALSLPTGGSMAAPIRVFDVVSGRFLPDELDHVTGETGASVAWNAEGTGFYYTHYPREGQRPAADLNFYEQIYFHKLSSPQSEDTYALGKAFPRIVDIWLSTSEDNRYILAEVGNSGSARFEQFLRTPAGQWTQVSHFSDGIEWAVFGDGALYMVSRKNAPRGKMLRVPLHTPYMKFAQTIIPGSSAVIQASQYTLAGLRPMFAATSNLLYVTEILGGPSEIHIFDHHGEKLGIVPSEPLSAITQLIPLEGNRILFDNESYFNPPAWFNYDPRAKQTTVTALREESPVAFDDAEAVREFCISKDGTRIPLNVIRRKGTALNGKNPAILTAYGGFGLVMSPSFDPEIRAWLDAGGVFAIANIRGGGEFGEEWHAKGSGIYRQNAFDDFIACAEHLIHAGYTNPLKLGIEGGSNGGLLMGAALTQRPELFRAVVAVAGPMDMLREENSPNGQTLVTEFGSVKDPTQFKALFAYSPYHHVREGVKYPAVLFNTGDNDPAVDPAHSRKMAARLQAATASRLPVLLINFTNSGHGGIGSSEDQQAAIDTYQYEFLFDQLGVTWPDKSRSSSR
jgi:prolyl oligopeptidase